jgi:two-component system, sensor histidine kinase and response regulator
MYGGIFILTTAFISSHHCFDETGLLKRYMGNESLARDLVLLFVAKTPGYMAEIHGQLSAGKPDGVHHQAHSLKGAAATVGADRLAALAAEIVEFGKSNKLDEAMLSMQQLEVEYEALLIILAERGWITPAISP